MFTRFIELFKVAFGCFSLCACVFASPSADLACAFCACFKADNPSIILPDDLKNLDLLYYFKDILSNKTQEVYINNEVSLNLNQKSS